MRTTFAILLVTMFTLIANANDAAGFKMDSVEQGSLYERMGLKAGDVIKSVNGKAVTSSNDVTRMADEVRDGKKVKLDLLRGDSDEHITYQLESKTTRRSAP